MTNFPTVDITTRPTTECVDYFNFEFDALDLHTCWRIAADEAKRKSKSSVEARRRENVTWRRFFQGKFNLKKCHPHKVCWYRELDENRFFAPFFPNAVTPLEEVTTATAPVSPCLKPALKRVKPRPNLPLIKTESLRRVASDTILADQRRSPGATTKSMDFTECTSPIDIVRDYFGPKEKPIKKSKRKIRFDLDKGPLFDCDSEEFECSSVTSFGEADSEDIHDKGNPKVAEQDHSDTLNSEGLMEGHRYIDGQLHIDVDLDLILEQLSASDSDTMTRNSVVENACDTTAEVIVPSLPGLPHPELRHHLYHQSKCLAVIESNTQFRNTLQQVTEKLIKVEQASPHFGDFMFYEPIPDEKVGYKELLDQKSTGITGAVSSTYFAASFLYTTVKSFSFW